MVLCLHCNYDHWRMSGFVLHLPGTLPCQPGVTLQVDRLSQQAQCIRNMQDLRVWIGYELSELKELKHRIAEPALIFTVMSVNNFFFYFDSEFFTQIQCGFKVAFTSTSTNQSANIPSPVLSG